ncbi:hypothetical protein N8586_01215 [Verrucomicrobiales bacterium]|nr:hypothetical protein [Verrucomicrobiales bacterium]
MKSLLAFASLITLLQLAPAQQLSVGTLSQDVDFALLDGGLTNSKLSEAGEGIVVLYYYTPW